MGKFNTKRTLQALARREIVAELYKRGYSYREIRSEVMARLNLDTYSLRTVHKDVVVLLEEWRESRNINIDQAVQLELQRIDTMDKEAWEAWDKSKTDYEKKRSHQFGKPSEGGDGNGGDGQIRTTSVAQFMDEMVCCGDPRYLDVIHRNGVERRKILGIYAPEKQELTGKDGAALIPEFKIEIIDHRDQVKNDDTDDTSVRRNPIGYR